MSGTESKTAVRHRLLSIRRSLSRDEVVRVSRSIVERLTGLPEIRAAQTVLAYWPMSARGELDIRPLLLDMVGRGITVGLPVIECGAGRRSMVFAPLSREADLVPGPFSTLQPAGVPLDARAADVVIVPALGATRGGHRMGYGGGYYDRFLAGASVFTAVPLFSGCLVDSLPTEPHDVPIDAVITEHEEIRTLPRA